MTPLPGRWLDLLTDGVEIHSGDGKFAVTKALRSVMLAAHRAGWEYRDLYPYLTDIKGRKLAAQVATGQGGRAIPVAQRATFLQRHWDETKKVVAEQPTWTHDDVIGANELVRQRVAETDDLTERDRGVMSAVLDLADLHGTTKVAAPVRAVAAASGLSRVEAHRVLMSLCDRGWLVLAQRGNHAEDPAGCRSNIYGLSPSVLGTYRPALPPMSQPVPMSLLPMSQEEDPVKSAVSYEVTAAEDEAIAKVLEAIRVGAAGTTPEIRVTDQAGNVVQLDSKRRRLA
jgi:hypothetical protein